MTDFWRLKLVKEWPASRVSPVYISSWLLISYVWCCAQVSFLVGIYYNVLITWCLWYFTRSFAYPLPWSKTTDCGEQKCQGLKTDGADSTGVNIARLALLPAAGNASMVACRNNLQGNVSAGSIQWPGDQSPPPGNLTFYTWRVADPECSSGSRTQYFFYRRSLDITESIEDVGGFNLNMFLFLSLAWFIIYVCLVRGIKSSGKVCDSFATRAVQLCSLQPLPAADSVLLGAFCYFAPDVSC